MNGGMINSVTRLHLVGYFYWVILRCTDPWILSVQSVHIMYSYTWYALIVHCCCVLMVTLESFVLFLNTRIILPFFSQSYHASWYYQSFFIYQLMHKRTALKRVFYLFHVNFNILFKAVLLCISWQINNFDIIWPCWHWTYGYVEL